MSELERGQTCNIICLVKDGVVNDLISKQGKPYRKKEISLFDLDNKIEAQLVLFADKCDI